MKTKQKMTAEIIYTGSLRTEATHIKSGAKVVTDAPTDNRGQGEAFSPTDMIATGLATCILTIMGIRALDNEFSIDGATAQVKKYMVNDPRRIAKIEIEFTMPENDYNTEQRAIIEDVLENNPVGRSLSPQTEQVLKVHWH